MKQRLILLLLPPVFVACNNNAVKGPNGVTYKSAVQYNDYIVNRQVSLRNSIMEVARVAQYNLDSAEILLNEDVRQTEKIITELEGMPPYHRDSALRDAAVRIFSFYKKAFDQDYRDIIRLRRNETDSSGAGEQNDISTIVEKIKTEEEEYDKNFKNTQDEFARKNNMKLVEKGKQDNTIYKNDPK